MRAPIVLVLLSTWVGCGQTEDDCQRAFARIQRIDAARGQASLSAKVADESLIACRQAGRGPKLDPILRCAMDSETDDAATLCIDRFIDGVLIRTPGDPSHGSGINPLIQK